MSSLESLQSQFRPPAWLRLLSGTISKVCAVAAVVGVLAAVVVIGSYVAASFIDGDGPPKTIWLGGGPAPRSSIVGAAFGDAGIAISGVAIFASFSLLGAWSLWSLGVCFAGVAKAEPFAPKPVRGFRNFVIGLILAKTVPFAVLLSVIGTGFALTGYGPHPIPVTHDDVVAHGLLNPLRILGVFMDLLLLGVLVVLTGLLTRAARIAEDHAQIV